MRFQTRAKHVIDLLFPIALFFVFAASALAVLIIAANLYRSNASKSQAHDERRIVLSYLSQKMHQNDNGHIDITPMEGIDCLTFTSEYNESQYHTYVYVYEGNLKELFVKEGVSVALTNGKNIMEVTSLSMDEPEDGLFHFVLANKQGRKDNLYLAERSSP